MVKSNVDGILAVGVDGGIRTWTGGEEIDDPTAPSGSVIGGDDTEVCHLAPDGQVSCFWYNALVTESVDKAMFQFGTAAYVDLDQDLMIIGAISQGGSLLINHQLEDSVVQYTELKTQVAIQSDYWCMLSNTGEVAYDAYDAPGGVMDAPSGEFLAVDVNEDFACAVRPTGDVECWGTNAPAFDSLVRLD